MKNARLAETRLNEEIVARTFRRYNLVIKFFFEERRIWRVIVPENKFFALVIISNETLQEIVRNELWGMKI